MYPGRTKAQKAELARVITEAMVTIANTQAQAVDIVFNEVSQESWSFGGVLASDR
jgi:4-oxalocrotonate tautomerase family enzyme